MGSEPAIWRLIQAQDNVAGAKQAARAVAAEAGELLTGPRVWKANSLVEIRNVWGGAFDLCDLVVDGCAEVVGLFLPRYSGQAESEDEQRFLVLRDLFERAWQASWEGLVLLSHGAPAGSLARWRTVHELSVVGAFISEHDRDLARQYKDWHRIELNRMVFDGFEAIRSFGITVEAPDVIADLEDQEKELKEKYGRAFSQGSYGWTADALRSLGIDFGGRVGLRHLEQAVGRAEGNVWYRQASHAVHAGLLNGVTTPGAGAWVAGKPGPRLIGLADPGRLICVDLWIAAGNLLALYEDPETTWAHDVLSEVAALAIEELTASARAAREREGSRGPDSYA